MGNEEYADSQRQASKTLEVNKKFIQKKKHKYFFYSNY